MHHPVSASYEVRLSSPEDVSRVAQLTVAYALPHLSIVHKELGITEVQYAQELQTLISPTTSLTLHFSVKNLHPEQYADWFSIARECNPQEILLVSGHPRPEVDSLNLFSEILRQCKQHDLPSSFAYSHTASISSEKERLVQKLSHSEIKAMYLQINDNPDQLIEAIQFIRSLRPDISLYACLLIPTPALREKLMTKPWYGMNLSHEYLTDQITAEEKTIQLLHYFNENTITPLIEILPFDQTELEKALALLRAKE